MNANEATLVLADEYGRLAETYDRLAVPRFEGIAGTLLELVAPSPNELILDVATGTGLLARLLAPRVRPQTVVAIDLADPALAVASHRAGGAGIHNIRFEMMDARNIVYRGGIFDAVASNLGMPALGYDRTFQEARRVLKPEGRFVFSEWDARTPDGDAMFQRLLEVHRTRTPSKALVDVREALRVARSDPEAKALGDPDRVRERLRDTGFSSVQVVSRSFPASFATADDLIAFQAAWGWDERELAEMPVAARAAFDADVATWARDRATAAGLLETFPIHFYIARP